jgi:uncharacterized protein (UPF0212 family)
MIPQRFIIRCPACGTGLEASLCAWQMTVAQSEEMGPGIALEMTSFASHSCEEDA